MAHTAAIALSLLMALSACKTTEPAQPDPAPAQTTAAKTEAAKPAENVDSADALRAAVDNPTRTQEERTRDAYRHPYETLTFLEVKPEHEVLELWSGGGWYTHILAPYLAESGRLHVTVYPEDSEKEYRRKMTQDMSAYLAANQYTDSVNVITLNTDDLSFGVEDQVDVVLTFRNVHNWVKGGFDQKVYEQAYKALKPGGVFGVIEHRGPKGMTREQSATSGYMDQDQVIKDVQAAGFQFVESSEVNANPNDTKDHPEGVWTLPPSLRLKDTDRDKYVTIGESDRMTLKFMKPMNMNEDGA